MWVAADVVGVLMLVLGAIYLTQDAGRFGLRFPSSTLEAAATVVFGLGLVCVAAIKMLVEVFGLYRGTATRTTDHAASEAKP